MTILEPPQPRLNIPEGINRAIEYTRRFMFNPFDFGTWLNVGVMAFIASLASSGGGGLGGGANFQSRYSNTPDTFEVKSVQEGISNGKEWLAHNLPLVVMAGAAILVIAILLGLLLLWLSCRGKLMLIRAVAQRDVRIGENWIAVARPAWSLFLFRIVVSLVSLLILVAVLAMGAVMVLGQIQQGTNHVFQYFRIVMPVLALGGLLWLCVVVFEGVLDGLVTPLMYHFDLTCLDAWRRLGAIARGNGWRILLFVVIRVAYTMGVGLASAFVGCFTCCIGFFPVVRQTIFAFFYVFDRAFSLYVLESLGSEYQIILPDPRDAVPAPPPLPGEGSSA